MQPNVGRYLISPRFLTSLVGALGKDVCFSLPDRVVSHSLPESNITQAYKQMPDIVHTGLTTAVPLDTFVTRVREPERKLDRTVPGGFTLSTVKDVTIMTQRGIQTNVLSRGLTLITKWSKIDVIFHLAGNYLNILND